MLSCPCYGSSPRDSDESDSDLTCGKGMALFQSLEQLCPCIHFQELEEYRAQRIKGSFQEE